MSHPSLGLDVVVGAVLIITAIDVRGKYNPYESCALIWEGDPRGSHLYKKALRCLFAGGSRLTNHCISSKNYIEI